MTCSGVSSLRRSLASEELSATGACIFVELSYRRLYYTIRRLFMKGHAMAEDVNPGQATGTGGGEDRVGVLLDERELRTFYANAYRIHTSAEEVVIDLGFNMPNPNPNAPGGAALLFKVTDRAILSYANAKRLTMSL